MAFSAVAEAMAPYEGWVPAIVAAAFASGFTRGFMGFGGAMIFVPATAAILGPPVAVACIWFFDLVIQVPLLLRALRHAVWREIAALALAAMAFTPPGVAVLVLAEQGALRWTICALILVAVGILAAGWRPSRAPGTAGQVGIGALAGLFGGAAGIPGPPVIIFYLTGDKSAAQVRANLIVFFSTTTVVSGLSYWVAGLLTREAAVLSAILVVPFALGTWLGARAFPLAGERNYRRIGFGLIVLVALVSLPAFDRVLGR